MSYIGQTLPADTFQGFTTDSFAGDGSATTFTLSKTPFNESALLVVINNVVQKPTTNFTVSGTTLTIVGTAVASGDVIYATHIGGALPIGQAASLDLNGASDQLILDADADTTISADTDDQIDFKAGGTDVMSMTATGLTINDGVEITTADNTDTLTLTSTDADASSGPNLRFYRNSSSPADNDVIVQVDFEGRNDNSQDVIYGQFLMSAQDVSDGTEDSVVTFGTMKAGSLTEQIGFNASEVVFNNTSADIDFRVESNGNANMLVVNSGQDAVIIGTNAQASGELFGLRTTASQKVIFADCANASNSQDIFFLACARAGTSSFNFGRFMSDSTSGQDSEFIFTGEGTLQADGSFAGGGADYAEYFEWKDGNSSSEDRRGYSVVLDGNKIVQATDSDDASKIIGVISANPAVIGDSDIERWKQKHLKDDYGTYIWEDYTHTEWTIVEEGKDDIFHSYQTDLIPDGLTVPDNAIVTTKDEDGKNLQRRKVNPDWNKDTAYISREDRKEWDTVGLMGKLRLKKGQPTGTSWIKMRDISETVEEWLVR